MIANVEILGILAWNRIFKFLLFTLNRYYKNKRFTYYSVVDITVGTGMFLIINIFQRKMIEYNIL